VTPRRGMESRLRTRCRRRTNGRTTTPEAGCATLVGAGSRLDQAPPRHGRLSPFRRRRRRSSSRRRVWVVVRVPRCVTSMLLDIAATALTASPSSSPSPPRCPLLRRFVSCRQFSVDRWPRPWTSDGSFSASTARCHATPDTRGQRSTERRRGSASTAPGFRWRQLLATAHRIFLRSG